MARTGGNDGAGCIPLLTYRQHDMQSHRVQLAWPTTNQIDPTIYTHSDFPFPIQSVVRYQEHELARVIMGMTL